MWPEMLRRLRERSACDWISIRPQTDANSALRTSIRRFLPRWRVVSLPSSEGEPTSTDGPPSSTAAITRQTLVDRESHDGTLAHGELHRVGTDQAGGAVDHDTVAFGHRHHIQDPVGRLGRNR